MPVDPALLDELEQKLSEKAGEDEAAKQLAALERESEDLARQHAQLLSDGQVDQAVELSRRMRAIDREIARAEILAESRQMTASAIESDRVELVAAQLEAAHPVLNRSSEQFDSSLTAFVLSEQARLIQQGVTPSKALLQAATDIVARYATPREASVEKEGLAGAAGTGDRAAATVKRNIEASKSQPPSLKEVGTDSDKAGQTTERLDVSKLTQEEFDALPESAKAKLRGDFL